MEPLAAGVDGPGLPPGAATETATMQSEAKALPAATVCSFISYTRSDDSCCTSAARPELSVN